jgi:hypothetical protein
LETLKLASELNDMSEALLNEFSDSDSGFEDLATLIEIIDQLDRSNRNIRFALTAAKTLANIQMDKRGEQRVVLPKWADS